MPFCSQSFPPNLNPCQLLICSVTMVFFRIFYKWNCKVCSLLALALYALMFLRFIYFGVLFFFLHISVFYSILLLSNILLYVYPHNLITHSPSNEHLGSFQFGEVINWVYYFNCVGGNVSSIYLFFKKSFLWLVSSILTKLFYI